MGNPSDGFFGKTISLSISNFWAEVTIVESSRVVRFLLYVRAYLYVTYHTCVCKILFYRNLLHIPSMILLSLAVYLICMELVGGRGKMCMSH